jgi:hypothetical protein
LFVPTGDKPWNANSGGHCISSLVAARRDGFGSWSSFFDYEIVGVYLWAVLHERPVSWACDPKNWPPGLWQREKLPSQSTVSRRLQTTEVHRVLDLMEGRLVALDGGAWVRMIDGKPLVVSPHSKDREATWGRAGRGFARGYKLHAVYGSGSLPPSWEVHPLNVSEIEVAAHLIPRLPEGGGYLLGDKMFDSNRLHRLATARHHQLLAARRRPGKALGHRRHSAGRLRCMELLETEFGKALYRSRPDIERQFGYLTNHGGGLAPLPAWVRTWHRVHLWIHAKLLIHAVYTYRDRLHLIAAA